jgi:hypothetical protein
MIGTSASRNSFSTSAASKPVGPVTFPAYEGATAGVRSFERLVPQVTVLGGVELLDVAGAVALSGANHRPQYGHSMRPLPFVRTYVSLAPHPSSPRYARGQTTL